MEGHAFTIREGKILNCLTTSCLVCKAYSHSEGGQPDIRRYSAIWDTGATNSVIDKKVASDLGLIPCGISKAFNTNGSAMVNQYMVNIVLPNEIMVYMVPVTEGMLNGADVLIGMDIIGLGDFAITHKHGGTVFSFQMPSTHEYDFVKELRQGGG